MDAKLRNVAVCLTVCFFSNVAVGATHQTTNFIVTAPSDEIARKVGRCAEVWREDLAIAWLGKKLPNWYRPCPISVKVGQIGAGGSTTFTFDGGQVYGWDMKVQGTLERILDSVIPHEVNHTIFASHFRRPLPRWADEGAATLFEHRSEQARQIETLDRVIKTNRRIPLQKLLTIREYPEDMQDVLTLYAEGFSLARFLVGQKGEEGRTVYLNFLDDAHTHGWTAAIQKHYGFKKINDLEAEWTDWVLAGSPEFQLPAGEALADAGQAGHGEVIRSQSPDEPEPLAMIPRGLRSASRRTGPAPVKTVHQPESNRPSQINNSSMNQESVRGDAGDSRLRSGKQKLVAPPIPRESLSPTADGISSNPNAKAYQFPQMRAF
ncbi:gluzincin family metallopeptidase [Thalassoglobus polymorphus]|uniref:Peptidase MA-like domain-containing protein n=1 Tax=Thalassoglobus polymorphus TaxID=2527994 RepID=A0A517QLW1_9PLAN|nr:hypothetical protein [Thalassoglobus polymorphus]QDT32537.1 hypothetical protein Mal48_17840 [Thalassoglobus polymorphus]